MERDDATPRVGQHTHFVQRGPRASIFVYVDRGPESADKCHWLTVNLDLYSVKGIARVMFAGRE